MTTSRSLSQPAPAAGSSDLSEHQAERFASEWLLVDGLGGFASGTAALCPMRRYHGLFFARLPGEAKRTLLLSRFEEQILLPGEALGKGRELSSTRWADGTLAPRGENWIEDFVACPWPSWELRDPAPGSDLRLTREVLMTRGERGVLCRYVNKSQVAFRLVLRPFFPFRDADALTFENEVLIPSFVERGKEFVYRAYDSQPGVRLGVDSREGVRFVEDPSWYNGLAYRGDEDRGYEGVEDQFSPCVIVLELKPGGSVLVEARLDAEVAGRDLSPQRSWRVEVERSCYANYDAASLKSRLEFSADDFLYADDSRIGIVAGWPWFTEWGRDTCIALPGLTLARGDRKACREILDGLAKYIHHGLLPNIFGASIEDSHYGSADAALWFSLAVRRLDRARAAAGECALGETETKYLGALTEIAEAVFEAKGQDPEQLGVHADEAGLYVAGSEALNATWMDAQTSQGPVTPRAGCAVELNALWCQLLQQLEEGHASSPKKTAKLWKTRRRAADKAFLERFWLKKEERLADVWSEDDGADSSIRPNMVMAAALEYSPLTKSQRSLVLEATEKALLTPVGLRTLASNDPQYIGRYEGGSDERDGAYHQGTVWPWPIGFYVEASLRAHKKPSKKLIARLTSLMTGFATELDRAGLDHVSEVFDGDEPRRPGGTIAQAWNTAELLRALDMLNAGHP